MHTRLTALAVATAVTAALLTPATAASAAGVRHAVAGQVSGRTARFSSTSTRPGWTRIRNTGRTPFVVLRVEHGTAADLVTDYNQKRYVKRAQAFPLTTTVDSFADAYARLSRGSYFILDASHGGKRHVSQIDELTVTGDRIDATLPTPSNTIVVDKHLNPHAAATVKQTHYVKLVDHTPHDVIVEAIGIDADTSTATIKRFVAHPSFSKIETLSAHPLAYVQQDAAPLSTIYNPTYKHIGREMLLCFDSGKLHPGQAKLINVR